MKNDDYTSVDDKQSDVPLEAKSLLTLKEESR